jgi:hypothetical protein
MGRESRDARVRRHAPLVSRFRRSHHFAARTFANARRRAGSGECPARVLLKVAALAARFARQRGYGNKGTLATL